MPLVEKQSLKKQASVPKAHNAKEKGDKHVGRERWEEKASWKRWVFKGNTERGIMEALWEVVPSITRTRAVETFAQLRVEELDE